MQPVMCEKKILGKAFKQYFPQSGTEREREERRERTEGEGRRKRGEEGMHFSVSGLCLKIEGKVAGA